jgi:hypothetical protein
MDTILRSMLGADVKPLSAARRASAIVALAAGGAVFAVTVAGLVEEPLSLMVALAGLGMAIAAASYAVTRAGARRVVAAAVAVLALVAPLVLVVASGRLLHVLLLIALLVLAGAATRHALGRDIRSLKSGPTPGVAVGPATHPVLIMNAKSGGGKVERFQLVEEARRRGIEPIVLAPGDDLRQLAEQAVARGADVIGMAGGDGSQAAVAAVATAHDVGFVCVPAGTRNHLAMDLGLDRDDLVGALDAFEAAVERGPHAAPLTCGSPGPTGPSNPPHTSSWSPTTGMSWATRRALGPGGASTQGPWHRRGAAPVPRRHRAGRPDACLRVDPTARLGRMDRHHLRDTVSRTSGAGPADQVPDPPHSAAHAHPTTRARLLARCRRANPGLGHPHRAVADGHRPTGDHRTVIPAGLCEQDHQLLRKSVPTFLLPGRLGRFG